VEAICYDKVRISPSAWSVRGRSRRDTRLRCFRGQISRCAHRPELANGAAVDVLRKVIPFFKTGKQLHASLNGEELRWEDACSFRLSHPSNDMIL